jgi:carbon storage regulator
MLVLSRQRDETIMIGDEIEITVVDIRGDKVRLGISAPTRIAVHRKEVYESIRRENEQAATLAGSALPTVGLAGDSRVRPLDLSSGPQRTQRRTPAAPTHSPPHAPLPPRPLATSARIAGPLQVTPVQPGGTPGVVRTITARTAG